MSSWASIAKASRQPVVAAQDHTGSTENLRLLVVDANAIISGVHLDGIADRAVTIQEVFDEIRDKQSRQFLTNLPYKLQLSEPTDESIKTVTRFARETGDIAALSSVDIKLLALAHSLEAAAHGTAHLAAHASQPRMHSRATFLAQELPGWGNVPNPEDWKVVDEANDQDEAMAASASRIAQQVQQLSLDPSQPNTFLTEQPSAASTAAAIAALAAPMPAAAAFTSPAIVPAQQQEMVTQLESAVEPVAAAAADDDDNWELAASSQNAARRKKRKEYKRQEKQRAFEKEWEEHAAFMQQQQQQQEQQEQQQEQTTSAAADKQQQQQQNGVANLAVASPAVDAAEIASGSDSQPDDEQADGDEEVTNDDLLTAEHQVYTADDINDAAEDSSSSPAVAEPELQQQQQGELAPGMPGWQSSIACITADFAMQNVLLQMGLRLLTRDGRRIARLSRYALRCSACFNVTREPGRIFCPKCGNMTLDRVEVVVGPDGAEYFGVKKRHILRGTKFSLPKPRGGRNSKDPVLREDIFLLKVKALGRPAMKKKTAAAADATGDSVDPFAPEFSQDTWQVQSQAELAQHRGLAAVLQPAWKKNPNERKLTRSNRRG